MKIEPKNIFFLKKYIDGHIYLLKLFTQGPKYGGINRNLVVKQSLTPGVIVLRRLNLKCKIKIRTDDFFFFLCEVKVFLRADKIQRRHFDINSLHKSLALLRYPCFIFRQNCTNEAFPCLYVTTFHCTKGGGAPSRVFLLKPPGTSEYSPPFFFN